MPSNSISPIVWPGPLTILITNIWLSEYAGSEIVVRDLALGLLRRGHRPVIYSPKLGPIADEITARGVAVVDDLRRIGERPDVIHAHHVIPCGEALIRFPDVPALHVCHSFSYWIERPAHFPQIGVYVAVDEACRDRLVQMEGIDPQRVVTLPNAVDLNRIPPRPQVLPARPRRAVAFGKAAGASEPRIACEQLGIEFVALGAHAGRMNPAPECELVQFDLAFASARSALEAICCGCCVIACDPRGLAGIVTPENFQALRAKNFGVRSLTGRITVDRCVQEIARYKAAAADRVTWLARDSADLEKLLDRYEKLYHEILAGVRRPSITPKAHDEAVARFLYEYLPRSPGDVRSPWACREARPSA